MLLHKWSSPLHSSCELPPLFPPSLYLTHIQWSIRSVRILKPETRPSFRPFTLWKTMKITTLQPLVVLKVRCPSLTQAVPRQRVSIPSLPLLGSLLSIRTLIWGLTMPEAVVANLMGPANVVGPADLVGPANVVGPADLVGSANVVGSDVVGSNLVSSLSFLQCMSLKVI